ncbi:MULTISPECIES: hypothetical protein [Aphanothece]|uniref:hypothetical protein n=1 Tax=Aphanothece TaxID=1121 RepID=UPI003985495E
MAELLDQPAKRTPQEWKAWRKATVERVKQLLASNKGVVAARELSRAMLQDPEFPVFQELMQEAISIKLKRDVKAGQPDPWADLPKDLRAQALQLEGFQLYVEEVEQMLNKAGFPQLPAPRPKAK